MFNVQILFIIFLKLTLVLDKSLSFKFNLNTTKANITEIVSYMHYFNTEFFVNETSYLTVVKSYRNEVAHYYFDDLLSEYLKTDYIKYKLDKVDRNFLHRFCYFNVLLVDSYESFSKIDPGPKTTKEDFSEFYLIILFSKSQNPIEEIQKIFDYCWYYYIVNVALILKTPEEKPLNLYTYYPFTSKSCHQAQIYNINHNKSILDLERLELFPKKFRNFYNCTLKAALWDVPPYLMLPKQGKYIGDINGMEGFMIRILARVLRFKLDYSTPPNNQQRGLVRPNGTLTGAIKMLHDRVADFSLGCFRCTLDRSTILSPSKTFYQTIQVFTVLSLRERWTSLEIIAYPFDFNIWIILLVLILTLLTSPHILEYFSHRSLKFIYGYSSAYIVTTNIIAIALGQTSDTLPKRNFSRYLLLMWILLTMVLRSIYQGSLFDFLKTQKTLAPPDTVYELITRKYELILNMATGDSFSDVQIVRDKLVTVHIMNITDAGGFPILEAHPDKRFVTGSPRDFLTDYVTTNKKFGKFHVLKETVFAQQFCVYFTKHSYLVGTFDRIIQNLHTFGLIEFWASFLFDSSFLEQVEEEPKEAPLTFEQILGIVQICACLYLISFIVFVCEILSVRFKAEF